MRKGLKVGGGGGETSKLSNTNTNAHQVKADLKNLKTRRLNIQHDQDSDSRKKVDGEKNTSRDFKFKKAHIVWDVPEESSTTSTSEEEETVKICLMMKDNEASTSTKDNKLDEVNSYVSISCSSSNNLPTYDELYNAFVELHEELKKVAKVNVDGKRIILLHEKKIASMQKEMDELKLENETFDLIYSSASCMCSTKVIETPVCETCSELEMENDELKNKITKFTYSSQNLNRLLASSKNIGNRIGLGFKHKSKKRPFGKHVASKSHVINHKLPTCFYFGVHGHTYGSCYIKRNEVPSGKYVWVAKCAPGINVLAQVTLSHPGEIHPAFTDLSRLSEKSLAQGRISQPQQPSLA
ncbi:hypothetical protein Lal_00039905 [Lupinus albus]|nr:hypothetical protein Lal_00039905 [Lupinus albus]